MKLALLYNSAIAIGHTEVVYASADEFVASVEICLREVYGDGHWLVIPTASLPADFSVDTYTIADGALVPITETPTAV